MANLHPSKHRRASTEVKEKHTDNPVESDPDSDSEVEGDVDSDTDIPYEPRKETESSEESESEVEEEQESEEDIPEDLEENDEGDEPETQADFDLDAGEGGDIEEVTIKRKVPLVKKWRRKLFPFIPKTKRLTQAEKRPTQLLYVSLNFRDDARKVLSLLPSLNVKAVERGIYNASVRVFIESEQDIEEDACKFRDQYLTILSYVFGAVGKLSQVEILGELKDDTWNNKSKLWVKERTVEEELEKKITQPEEEASDNSLYPCPKCKGIKSFRQRWQDRGGDEASSLRLWCANSSCRYSWRLTG